MPVVAIAGGGLAGLAAASALGSLGFEVDVYEARNFLGGRATSYPLPNTEEHIDNCQHILLRCCSNLLAFYERLGVADRIEFHRTFHFIEPGGRTSTMRSGLLPAPLHFTESFATLRFLGVADKVAVARALLAIRSERKTRQDLDQITMLDWLREKHQTDRAIERFWRQILVSAINEELDRMAASHGFQVFWLGFLAGSNTYEMGIPSVPLGSLYGEDAWARLPNVRFHFRSSIDRIDVDTSGVRMTAAGQGIQADYVISALPPERLAMVTTAPLADWKVFEPVPITGIHLWFDRPVTDLPHGTLLDRTIQWFFNKGEGRYLMVVVSASRSLTTMGRNEVIELAVRELAEFLPAVADAELMKAHVVKEIRATFSASTGLESKRPLAATSCPNLFLAGDWTRSGWPATMEGAVRSGHIAADAVVKASGMTSRFLIPDLR